MQQAVIDELLAARPSGGFPTIENAPEGSLEAYVASSLWWHVRGAMGDAPPAKVLVEHEDEAIRQSVALALGKERLEESVRARETEGDMLGAARLSWLGCALGARGMLAKPEVDEFVWRAVSLLQACASEETLEFELEVLNRAFLTNPTDERYQPAMTRLKEVSALIATYQSKFGECLVTFNTAFAAGGFFGGERGTWPNPTWEHFEEYLDGALVGVRQCMEASELGKTEQEKNFGHLVAFHCMDFVSFMSHSPKWDHESIGGEKALVRLIDAYDYDLDGPVQKTNGIKADYFRMGIFRASPALKYGNLESLRVWTSKSVAAFKKIGLPLDYGSQLLEVWGTAAMCYLHLLVGEQTQVADLLSVIGFNDWGLVGLESWWPHCAPWAEGVCVSNVVSLDSSDDLSALHSNGHPEQGKLAHLSEAPHVPLISRRQHRCRRSERVDTLARRPRSARSSVSFACISSIQCARTRSTRVRAPWSR